MIDSSNLWIEICLVSIFHLEITGPTFIMGGVNLVIWVRGNLLLMAEANRNQS